MDKIPAGTWVIVADGGGARLFRNVGTDMSLALRQEEILDLQQVDVERDSGPGPMPDEALPRQVDEAAFARQLAAQINAAALKHEFEHLILAADPTTLGRMRPLLHKQVQARMLAELAKDLTNSPLADIQRSLS